MSLFFYVFPRAFGTDPTKVTALVGVWLAYRSCIVRLMYRLGFDILTKPCCSGPSALGATHVILGEDLVHENLFAIFAV